MTTVPATRPPRAPAPLPMTPGRWLTLMIGVPIALALIGWTGFSLVSGVGQAHYPVTGTIPLENGRLVASMGGADVTLHQDQARGSTARLTGTVQYSLVHPNFTVIGTAVNLDCRIPSGNCGLNATLDVPADIPVDLASGGGNVQASGIQRDVTLDTAGGNVNAGDLGGIMNFTTDGGDVTVNHLFSPHVKLATGGGNVTLVFTTAPTYLNITSDGGDVSIVLPHGSTAYYITSNPGGGNYSAQVPTTTNSKAPNTISVQSGGGNISIAES